MAYKSKNKEMDLDLKLEIYRNSNSTNYGRRITGSYCQRYAHSNHPVPRFLFDDGKEQFERDIENHRRLRNTINAPLSKGSKREDLNENKALERNRKQVRKLEKIVREPQRFDYSLFNFLK